MPAADKRKGSEYATPDLACTRCRERKIRCGRERPQCSNCERDEGVTCVYQNPARRVNHLKLLCDSVDQLQDRLTTIESQLGRLSNNFTRPVEFDDATSSTVAGRPSTGRRSSDGDNACAREAEEEEEDDDDDPSGSPLLLPDGSTDLHVFRSQVDMVDRYHGLPSLFALCNQFRSRTLAATNSAESGALQEMLSNLCETAGGTQPFPSYSDHGPTQLPPKQQALAAIGHFFQHLDCTTDIFVRRNLLANVERVYSQPPQPGDDAWGVCLKAIMLLVLGMEISSQNNNALFGDFARSLLPSRAALVSSHLLTTPRLINVQTLILLSVAAQQFDPPGWAELIFTHACILARTMGFHHAQLLASDAGTDEAVERAKVLQSLYARDKSLCTTRGSVSWLPSYDCKITAQLKTAIERQAPYSDRFQLAMIQDEVYHLIYSASRHRNSSITSKKSKAKLQSIEQQLDQYERTFDVFNFSPSFEPPRGALISMEFLATRILALLHGSEPRHAEQLRADARASCLLLLIAHGDQSRQALDALNSLIGSRTSPTGHQTLPVPETGTIPFANVLDAFSVPAFFVLFEGLLQPAEKDGGVEANTDLDLLQKLSACYSKSSAQMQSNNYHHKVARIFDQLLSSIGLFNLVQQGQHDLVPSLEAMADLTRTNSASQSPPSRIEPYDLPGITSPLPQADMSNLASWPPPPPPSTCASLTWDNWLSLPSSLGPSTVAGTPNMMDVSGTGSPPDLLAQILGASHSLPDSADESMQWQAVALDPPGPRKRSRTDEG